MTLPADPVWFITGCSTGFGRELARIVADRGWRLVATARDPAQVADLAKGREDRVKAVALDVTKPQQVQAAVKAALDAFGRIDVVVNNAGYGYMAAVEEGEDAPIRAMFETNVFGLVAVTQAVLPTLRAQGSGFVVNISSVAGALAFPGSGYYSATKHAVEAISEALAQELAPLGPKVMIVEPGPFRTDFASRSLHVSDRVIDAYKDTSGARRAQMKGYAGSQPGDPIRGSEAIIAALEADKPPLRLPLGAMAVKVIADKHAHVLAEIAAWKDVGLGADFPKDEAAA